MEDKDYTKASSRWLFEMNFLDNGYVKTALYSNIYNASPSIKDAELLVDQYNKRMLIYLDLSFFGKILKKNDSIATAVEMIVKDVLPEYELRVIYDKVLFAKATEMLNPTHVPEEATPKEEDELVTKMIEEEPAEDESPAEDEEKKEKKV